MGLLHLRVRHPSVTRRMTVIPMLFAASLLLPLTFAGCGDGSGAADKADRVTQTGEEQTQPSAVSERPELSVVKRPRSERDQLPRYAEQSAEGDLGPYEVEPDRSRYVGNREGVDLYVVPATGMSASLPATAPADAPPRKKPRQANSSACKSDLRCSTRARYAPGDPSLTDLQRSRPHSKTTHKKSSRSKTTYGSSERGAPSSQFRGRANRQRAASSSQRSSPDLSRDLVRFRRGSSDDSPSLAT